MNTTVRTTDMRVCEKAREAGWIGVSGLRQCWGRAGACGGDFFVGCEAAGCFVRADV